MKIGEGGNSLHLGPYAVTMKWLFYYYVCAYQVTTDECRPVRYETLCLVLIKDLSVYLSIIDTNSYIQFSNSLTQKHYYIDKVDKADLSR